MEIVSTYEGIEMDIHIHIPLRKLVTGICLVAFLAFLYFSARSQIGRISEEDIRQEVIFGQTRGTETMEKITRDGSRKFFLLLGKLQCVPKIPDVPVSKPHRADPEIITRVERVPSPAIPGISAGLGDIKNPSVDHTEITDTEVPDAGSDTGTDTENPPAPVPLNWKVTLYGNGGKPEEAEHVFETEAFSLEGCEEPRRLGKLFDGWYEDAACTVPFTGVTGEGGELKLYAGWREFEGFTANDEGLLTGCTSLAPLVTDGLLVLPLYDTCTGIAANAFDGADVEITDIYIPANIHRIEPGVFDCLLSLVYIEAAPGNPYYYSEEGILYNWNGTVAAEPKG